MGMLSEFRAFIRRGNVLDLAIGVVIGAAFGKIVSSFVANVLLPPVGLLFGSVHFNNLKVVLGGTSDKPVTLNYGSFLQNIVDFLIVAWCVFLLVQLVNTLYRAEAPKPAEAPPQEKLLAEIRDLMRAQAGKG